MATPPLADYVRSPALAVCARRRFGALPLPADTRFTDEVDLPGLRRMHPEWRAEPLAPVELAQDVFSLPSESDASLACLIAFELLAAGDRLPEAIASAARVLRPGGAFVILLSPSKVGDEKVQADEGRTYAAPRCAAAAESIENSMSAVIRLHSHYGESFQLEQIVDAGSEHMAVLLRNEAALRPGDLVEHRGRVMIVDGGGLRHVTSPAALALVRGPDQPIVQITDRTLARSQLGPQLTLENARDLRGGQ